MHTHKYYLTVTIIWSGLLFFIGVVLREKISLHFASLHRNNRGSNPGWGSEIW